MEKAIEIKELSFKYDRDFIFRDVNLTVSNGDFVALIGPNGSGKSTFMKTLIGLLKPTKGEIKLLGQPLNKFKDWTKIGYISQGVRGFNKSFPGTVKEIIAGSLYHEMGFFKVMNRDLEEKIKDVLKLVGMEEAFDRQLGSLSGGQQQRVFIARILVNDPHIIFLDEPMVGIDAEAQQEIYSLINRLNHELGITIVMISHDIHIVSSQANKIACFGDKEINLHDASEFQCETHEGLTSVFIPEHSHRVVKK